VIEKKFGAWHLGFDQKKEKPGKHLACRAYVVSG
jgi:hypothetical protein